MSVPIRRIVASQRPRERLLREGATALSDAELVALLLGSGSAGTNAIDTAQLLLAGAGGVRGVAMARPVELARQRGIGPAKAARIAAAFELAARIGQQYAATHLRTSRDIATRAMPVIGRDRVEGLLVLVADGRNRLVHAERVAKGKAQGCPVPIREVLATVLRHDGVAFALAHNHPGGDPTPTPADHDATAALRDGAHRVGLRLLDHVVVTATDWRSVTAAG